MSIAPPSSPLLDLCDRVLGEVSRRQHLFSWLRSPDGSSWWPIDAYYPRQRLLVLCRPLEEAEVERCMALAPQHGLRVVRLSTDELPRDSAELLTVIRQRLGAPAPTSQPPPTGAATPAERNEGPRIPWSAGLERAANRMAAALAAQPGRASTRPRPAPHRLSAAQAEAARRAAQHLSAGQRPTSPEHERAAQLLLAAIVVLLTLIAIAIVVALAH